MFYSAKNPYSQDRYVFWTTSDNWEWMDGYCPKFGLWSVDREDGLKRTPRPSLQLFQRVATFLRKCICSTCC